MLQARSFGKFGRNMLLNFKYFVHDVFNKQMYVFKVVW